MIIVGLPTKAITSILGGSEYPGSTAFSLASQNRQADAAAGVLEKGRAATLSPPPAPWSDYLLHHQKQQSRMRRDWPSMPRFVLL